MPVAKLPMPQMGMTTEDLINLMFRYYRELEYILGHLNSDNVQEIDANKTRVLNLEQLLAQTIIAGDIITNTLVTNTLYANYARIAQLTVDELSTAWMKITNYLAGSLADVNYLYIHDQTIEFITASTDGLETRQETDRYGAPLYWLDNDHTGVTDVANTFPVTTYVYTELVKAHFSFVDVNGNYRPRITLGAGFGNATYPERGKAYVEKDEIGFLITYNKANGNVLTWRLGENGIESSNGETNISLVSSSGVSNGSEVVCSTSDTELCSVTLNLPGDSKVTVTANVYGTPSDDCGHHTLTIKLDNVSQKAGTRPFYSNETDEQTILHEGILIPSGSHTITLYGKCDEGSFTVDTKKAVMLVGYSANEFPTLADVTGFDTEVTSSSQINESWVNPTSPYFVGVELYRSTSNILDSTQAECASGATLIYNGTGTSKADTGRAANTTYYYKIFAKYTISNIDYYSDGVGKADNTTLSLYQEWSTVEDSPVLTSDYLYQFVAKANDDFLWVSTLPYYVSGGNVKTHARCILFRNFSGTSGWITQGYINEDNVLWSATSISEANNDIYSDNSYTTVYFAKTTQ